MVVSWVWVGYEDEEGSMRSCLRLEMGLEREIDFREAEFVNLTLV